MKHPVYVISGYSSSKIQVMPEQKGPFYFTGKVGNIVGYSFNGKHYYRSLALHVKISNATKLSGTDFGTASKAGKLIRHAIKTQLNIPCDEQYCNRLNKILLTILYSGGQQRGYRSFQHMNLCGLTGYKFNKYSKIDSLIKPVVAQGKEKNLQITFSPINTESIRHTIKTSHIELKVIAVGVNLTQSSSNAAIADHAIIDLSLPAFETILTLPFPEPAMDETIIVMQVRAFNKSADELVPSKNIKHFAAEIIGVIPFSFST